MARSDSFRNFQKAARELNAAESAAALAEKEATKAHNAVIDLEGRILDAKDAREELSKVHARAELARAAAKAAFLQAAEAVRKGL